MKIFNSFRFICATVLLMIGTGASAYEFTVDGIYYNVVSLSELTCSVTSTSGVKYTGNIIIPDKVTYNNTTFTVTSIGDNAFGYCSELTSIVIGNSVTSIGDKAFEWCTELTSIVIGNSVTSIGDEAFAWCMRLNFTIPSSVTSIGDGAFRNCYELTSVTIPNSVTSIGDYTFRSCTNLTSVTIPNSVTSIGYEAFCGCSRLASVTIPNSVTSIGCNAFQYCYGLTNVTIPNSVTSIDVGAFGYCSRLTSVTIGSSVTSIGYSAFRSCSGLASIYSLNPIPPTLNYIFFTDEQYYRYINVYVPQGSLSAYKSADEWKNFRNLQEFDPTTGVETIKTDGKNTKDTYYDIQGRKLHAPKKGINIINGRKVLIKK